MICVFAARPAQAQGDSPTPARREVHLETGVSFGNLRMFAFDDNRALHPVGVEYDRQWIRSVLGGNLEYVSEVLPLIILSGPVIGPGGQALAGRRKNQYGFGVAPMGFRLLWHTRSGLEPYFGVKTGAAYFKNRVPSFQGTHLQFLAEFSAGAEKAVSNRWSFRAGFSDFHLANATLAHRNAADFLTFNGGVSYRF